MVGCKTIRSSPSRTYGTGNTNYVSDDITEWLLRHVAHLPRSGGAAQAAALALGIWPYWKLRLMQAQEHSKDIPAWPMQVFGSPIPASARDCSLLSAPVAAHAARRQNRLRRSAYPPWHGRLGSNSPRKRRKPATPWHPLVSRTLCPVLMRAV